MLYFNPFFQEEDIDYSANSELKKLQFFGAGPKAAVPGSKGNVSNTSTEVITIVYEIPFFIPYPHFFLHDKQQY